MKCSMNPSMGRVTLSIRGHPVWLILITPIKGEQVEHPGKRSMASVATDEITPE